MTDMSERVLRWVALGGIVLLALFAWNDRASDAIDRQELSAALTNLRAAETRAGEYRQRNAELVTRIDSMSKIRAKRDTVYVARRAEVIPLLQPDTGISADSAKVLLPQVQQACTNAINACDAYKEAAEAELAQRRQQAQNDSTRIGELNTDLAKAQNDLLDHLTAPPKPPTFKEKLEKVAKVTVVVLAILGSFLLGQAAP